MQTKGMWMVAGAVACLAWGAGPEQPVKRAPARLCVERGGLPNVLARLRTGGAVRIAYFGGSITAADGWRVKTLRWFRERFPGAQIEEINATIGGTGSDLGAFRLGRDVLRHKPDLLFVEFAVNDGGAPPERIVRTMEGIVRQTWRANPSTDICLVYTFVVGMEKDLDRGECPPAASANEVVAERYGIPSINVALRIAELAREGRLVFEPQRDAAGNPLPVPADRVLFSHDRVHPLDAGHEVYTRTVTEAIERMNHGGKARRHRLGKPLDTDNWEDATLAPVEARMLSAPNAEASGSSAPSRRHPALMPGIWEATQPGQRLTFRFRGTGAYLYDLMGPDAGQVVVTVDGKAGPPVSRFDVFCTYHRLAAFPVADDLTPGEHTVTVEVYDTEPDRSAVVNAEAGKPGFDPKRYRGTVIRAGGVLVRGALLP